MWVVDGYSFNVGCFRLTPVNLYKRMHPRKKRKRIKKDINFIFEKYKCFVLVFVSIHLIFQMDWTFTRIRSQCSVTNCFQSWHLKGIFNGETNAKPKI